MFTVTQRGFSQFSVDVGTMAVSVLVKMGQDILP